MTKPQSLSLGQVGDLIPMPTFPVAVLGCLAVAVNTVLALSIGELGYAGGGCRVWW